MLFVLFSISLLLCAVPIKANDDWAQIPSRIVEFVFRPITIVFKAAGKILNYIFHKDHDIHENSLNEFVHKKLELESILSNLLNGFNGGRNLISETGLEDLQKNLNLLFNDEEDFNRFLPDILSNRQPTVFPNIKPSRVHKPLIPLIPRHKEQILTPIPALVPRPKVPSPSQRQISLRPYAPPVPHATYAPHAPHASHAATLRPQAMSTYKPQMKPTVKHSEPQKYPSAG